MLTLEQAIALALRENRLVKNAELGVGKAGDELAATRTHRLPSVHVLSLTALQLVNHEITLNNNRPDLLPGIGPFSPIAVPRRATTVFAGLVTQPLSQQYRIGLNIEEAKLARDVASERLRLAEQSTFDGVKRTYYGILQTQSALESIQEAIWSYRELDRVTGDYVMRQVSLKSDGLEVKTRLARAEYEALNLTNELATQKEQLNNLLGRDVRADFGVVTVPEVNDFGVDLEIARSRALDQLNGGGNELAPVNVGTKKTSCTQSPLCYISLSVSHNQGTEIE